jgi:hypothetical protein
MFRSSRIARMAIKKIWHGTIHTPDPLILKGELPVLNSPSLTVILWLTSTKVL